MATRGPPKGISELQTMVNPAMIERVVLHPLFHWSPTTRRDAIQRGGLRINSDPMVNTVRSGYICMSQSASQAWMLSAAACGERGESWDCWQVSLDLDDDVRVRDFRGNRIEELRVHNHIPKSRIWLVGTRTVPVRGRRW